MKEYSAAFSAPAAVETGVSNAAAPARPTDVPNLDQSQRSIAYASVENERVLPPRLLWRDPRPIPRLNRQEPVTVILSDPGFHEPRGDDNCEVFGYLCRSHDRPYRHESCGEGPHLVALDCQEHGLENMRPQPLMLMFPEGFDPPLSDAQLASLRTEDEGARPREATARSNPPSSGSVR